MPVDTKDALKVYRYMYDHTKEHERIDFEAVRKAFPKLKKEEYHDIIRYLRSECLIAWNGEETRDEVAKTSTMEETVDREKARPILFKQAEDERKVHSERKWQVILLVISSALSLIGGFALGWFSRGWTTKP